MFVPSCRAAIMSSCCSTPLLLLLLLQPEVQPLPPPLPPPPAQACPLPLHPLPRTHNRREALEAEAQKVAQLAVNAEGSVTKYRKQLEDATADLAAAQAAAASTEAELADIQAALSAATAAKGARACSGGCRVVVVAPRHLARGGSGDAGGCCCMPRKYRLDGVTFCLQHRLKR